MLQIVENVLDVNDSHIGTCSEFYVIQVKSPKDIPSSGRLPPPLMVFEVGSPALKYKTDVNTLG